jgi:hypothetical protein
MSTTVSTGIYYNWYELWSVLSVLGKMPRWKLAIKIGCLYVPAIRVTHSTNFWRGCDYLGWLFCSATDICGYTIAQKYRATQQYQRKLGPTSSPNQASLAATEHLTPQDFIQDYFLQELKRVWKCISITYQYISVMWFSCSSFSQFIYHGCLLLSLLHWHWAPRV